MSRCLHGQREMGGGQSKKLAVGEVTHREEMSREQGQEARVLGRTGSCSDISGSQWSPLLPLPQCTLSTHNQGHLLVESGDSGCRDSNSGKECGGV